MNILKKYIYVFLAVFMIFSCTDALTDLNVDPNRSPTAKPAEVLSSAQGFLGYAIDGQFNVRSAIWAQYWTWGPGVAIGNIERYVSDGTDYDNGWARMYSGTLTDLDFVENSSSKVHAGIAKLLKAYSFQLLVDNFGKVPFTEALTGPAGNFSPKYDEGQVVYDALIPLIDEGLTLLNADGTVGPEDFVYGGDVDKWTKFGNSLKLKILLRQANVKDVSGAVKDLVANGSFISSADEIAQIKFAGITGNENPMYAAFERSLGLFYIASSSSMTHLQETNDPRLGAFYNKAASSNNFVSIAQGSIGSEPFTNSKANYSVGSSKTYAKDNAVILMSTWEVWLLRAEAAARYGTADNGEMAFGNGVKASFDYLGVAGADAHIATLGYGGLANVNAKLKAIGTEKWVAMNGLQENESWIEARKFNTPDNPFFYNPTDGLYKKSTVSVFGDGVFPSLWLYPQTEISLNKSAPAQRALTDKAFWDN